MGVLNLILMVICAKADEETQADEAFQAELKLEEEVAQRRQLVKCCKQIDTDGGGTVSYDELKSSFAEKGQMTELFQKMNMDMEELDCAFQMMDSDGSGDVTY